ncbi:MAG TPA: hypothetical protein EYN17_03915 [Candidatus Poseidoniales archaeon]|nr:hypothetical protein [Candidatus Poseidoniales archaeon]
MVRFSSGMERLGSLRVSLLIHNNGFCEDGFRETDTQFSGALVVEGFKFYSVKLMGGLGRLALHGRRE